MPGVEILHSSEVLVSGGPNEEIAIITFIMCTFIGFIIGAIMSFISVDEGFVIGGSIIGFIFGIILGALTGEISSVPEVYETHYKVFVSDETSINEFFEHYEIIDQEGKIYTVKEKESVE